MHVCEPIVNHEFHGWPLQAAVKWLLKTSAWNQNNWPPTTWLLIRGSYLNEIYNGAHKGGLTKGVAARVGVVGEEVLLY